MKSFLYFFGRFVTSAKVDVMRSVRSFCLCFCLSLCLSLCVLDYCKSNEPVSLKLAVTIGPTN